SRELFGEMSVADNLLLGGFTQTSKDLAALRSEVYELFPRLRERAGQAADTLSGGERQMLALGRALMSRPRMLLLDEPSLGLAPIIIREMFELIKKVQSRGTSILLVEQNARMALKVADYAYLLEQGQVVLEGPASEVAGNPRVVGTYLGMGKKSSAPEQLSP
ncbi:MAG: ATP-binding cassette domain-containing protein, partial [Devosia sp.]|nr:ATP-binding cassette domain-containing protein [Devosia sp.]